MQLISFDNGYQRGGGVNLHSESVIQCWSKSEGEQNGHEQIGKK